MNIGYARVSTTDQKLDLQLDALHQAGCIKIFTDELSAVKADRPGLQAALDFLREGDTLVVWRLDRLGRSVKDLIQIVEGLRQDGVQFSTLTENIDTSTPSGEMVFHVIAALAQFERGIIRERTKAGLVAARSRGRVGGRKKALTPAEIKMIASLMQNRTTSVQDVLKRFGISKATLYRYVGPNGEVRQSGGKK